MNRFFALMAALFLIVALMSCQSDIVLPEEAPLKGTYEGVYSYITNFGAGVDQVTIKSHVIFIFDETSYHMNLDTTYTEQECFCAVDGQYALTEGIRLKEENSGPEEGCEGACNDELNPEGVFVRETKGDSLIMKLQEGTTLQMLRLLKIAE
ncbi:MAG: hypothetical protein OEV49_15895 [candidate division Zixibacteria bacterium]|nr:hypothetical protein [candidate division Zixibacteria bacterium]MDH3937444.1 hypothetical protein [candidate division Zixibacteria bacterium]MDH4034774.1 hypothetical protein [candidate division Zixibacteria bacterium]